MEVFISGIPFSASDVDLNLFLHSILHSSPYKEHWRQGVPMNFRLRLHRDKRGNRPHGGTGVLLIPEKDVGDILLQNTNRIPALNGRLLKWSRSRNAPDMKEVQNLLRTPYQDPETLKERQTIQKALSTAVQVSALQFGWWDRDDVFSVEWERSYSSALKCQFSFDPEKREVCVVEERNFEATLMSLLSRNPDTRLPLPRRVSARFSHVETISFERFSKENSILFTLYYPPNFETPIETPTMGEVKRLRKTSMDCVDHRRVVQYTSLAMRIVFPRPENVMEVLRMAKKAKLPPATPFFSQPQRRGHFSQQALKEVNHWIKQLPWPIAFQCSALLHNLRLTALELLRFRVEITSLMQTSPNHTDVAEILRRFGNNLLGFPTISEGPDSTRDISLNLSAIFRRSNESWIAEKALLRGLSEDRVLCHHVTVTPTTLIFGGPDPEESNRVLRRYHGNHSCFLRVNFTDEEKLQFRWDREVDGKRFVESKVGGILKKPLMVAGREFEFLAYSNSALKEHAVWFVTPFWSLEHGYTTADTIRAGLGNFDKVIRCPARYGARMSQAFTSTDTSISISAEEIIEIPDIKNEDGSVIFTDGIGCISRQTANDIIAALEKGRNKTPSRLSKHTQSAFQIRLGGNKGMLAVDYTHKDSAILIRPSMNKFIAADSLDIEIAGIFDKPKPMYLNRPLIMILETLGVEISAFTRHQENVITSTKESVRSLGESARLLEMHGLGTAFRITSVLQSLQKIGLRAIPSSEFFKRGMQYAVNDVLRDLKHRARIPIPDSYTLVGVADVHKYLKEGEIFVCIHRPNQSRFYLQGKMLVTRSPAIHPGDVQFANAIGRPRPGSPFEHERFANCVVFACQGKRSLPQSLGGGDLDGDLYNIITLQELFPKRTVEPGAYPPTQLRYLPKGRACTIQDVADFVVDYINNDLLGLISIENLKIADQSPLMSEDPNCLLLAQLHSKAVDFAKSGVPANLNEIPKAPSKSRPDWSVGEFNQGNSYGSTRALGILFRNVELPEISAPAPDSDGLRDDVVTRLGKLGLGSQEGKHLEDEISRLVQAKVEQYITMTSTANIEQKEIASQFQRFADQLLTICINHSLTRRPITEEECWAGTIIMKSSQPRQRGQLQARLREQCTTLVNAVRDDLSQAQELEGWLSKGWTAWKLSQILHNTFGARSYGYVALGSIFEALKRIEERDQYL